MKIRKGEILFFGRLFLIFAASAASSVYAEEAVPSADRDDLERLQETVDHLTDLATQTRLNADYVPGMVTVFYGRDLEDRGIRSAGEALNLVPGMNLSHTSHIYWKTVVRGVPRPFAAGHVKLLLNGTPLTTTFGIDLVSNLPIEQVDRIEIVRGPGSAIHGEYAVTGVMNIITCEEGSRAYGAVGSYGTLRGGGLLSLDFPDSDLKVSLNISGAESEGADVNVGPGEMVDIATVDDGFGNNHFGNNHRDSRAGLLSLKWRRTSLRAHLLESNRDRWYRTRQISVAARQGLFLTPSLRADAELSFLKRKFDSDLEGRAPSAWQDSPEGWVYEFNYDEKKVHAGLDLTWSIKDRQRLLFGYSFTRSELSDVWREVDPEERYKGDDRRINSLRLQEEWQPHDQVILIGGVRYDHYDDIGEQFSPRIAAVFRLNKQRGAIRQHVLKAQYGRAFRPPTFLETRAIGSGLDADPETTDTYELGYITRKFDEVCRITVFHSDLNARIDGFSDKLGRYYVNGLELEYARPLIPNFLELDVNLSYARTEDRETGDKIPESADWLTNIGLTFNAFRWLSLSLLLHSAFERNEDPAFGAGDLDDSHLLDFTARVRYPAIEGLTLRCGVKNLFEEDIRFPYERAEWGYGNDSGAPGDDRPGRFWWVSLSYKL